MFSNIHTQGAHIIIHMMLFKFVLIVEAKGINYKPTNSLTIRQSDVCLNHASGSLVANPDDCKFFYLCTENGEAVVAHCPGTMVFNPQANICDVATNVQCKNGNDSSITGNELDMEIIDPVSYCATMNQQLNRIVFIGSSTNCQQYYICYYGQALLQECSTDLHWNANIGKCDIPSKAACTLGTHQTQVTQNNNGNSQQENNDVLNNEDIASINCPSYGEHIFPHMTHCEFFVYCVKGHAILQRCPFYYHFDIISKNCKWRTTAICALDLNLNIQKSSRLQSRLLKNIYS